MYRKYLYLVFSILCLAGIASMTSAASEVTNDRYEINGTGQIKGDNTKTLFNGKSDLSINGEKHRANVALTLLEPMPAVGNPNSTARSLFRFTFEDNSQLITEGNLQLTPTERPNYSNMTVVLTVTEGKGIYTNYRGQLQIQGNMNTQQNDATLGIKGVIETKEVTQ